jgi:hypothetical protein
MRIISGEDGSNDGMSRPWRCRDASSVSPALMYAFFFPSSLLLHSGQRRIKQLADNSAFFRSEAKKMGFIVYGACGRRKEETRGRLARHVLAI